MTQEQKGKLEQAAIQYGRAGKLVNECYPFMDGAQTILENPDEFGLVDAIKAQHSVCDVLSKNEKLATEVTHMHYQLTKYREALEAIKSECDPNNPTHEKIWRIAFNATSREVAW